MDEKFKRLVNGESEIVDIIIEAMFHTKKYEARRFLVFINDIIDYYLTRPPEDRTCFPIIHIPNSPDWAREVLLNFLIIKLTLYYNEDKRKSFAEIAKKGHVSLSGNPIQNNYYKNYYVPFRKYIRQILTKLDNSYFGETGHKNLIVCRENDLTVSRQNQHKYISEFYGEIDKVCSKDNLTICHNLTASEIRKQIKESAKDVNLDNIFIFYTNNKQCNSLNESAFRLLKNRIKNCFIFDFSEKPFRLYHSKKKKITFCHKFIKLPEKEALYYNHYITLSDQESKYIFDLEYKESHCYLEDNQLFFNGLIGDLIDDSEHPILERIHLSLCLDEIQSREYAKRLSSLYPGYLQDFYQMSLDYQIELAQTKIIPCIKEFIDDSPDVGVILPYDASEKECEMFQRIFPEVTKLRFYTLSDLKQIKKKNKIKEKKVLNFVYRPHYINTLFHKYPNSFDSYLHNDNQFVMEIINGFAFGNMYLWDKYEYDKQLTYLLNSTYRKDRIGEKGLPKKPTIERANSEIDLDDDRINSRSVQSYKFTFEDGSNMRVPENELVIILEEEDIYISKLSDVIEVGKTNFSMQKLNDIKYVLEEFMATKTKDADSNEKLFRKHCFEKGMISEIERDSEDYLWKILLWHKVEKLGAKKVYEELMSEINEGDRIQYGAFKHWYTKNSVMMLPLQKVCQKRLIEYLELQNTPYLGIMRNKKRATRNGTRQSNNMMDNFLQNFLFQEIDNVKFLEFFDSEINDILQIENIADLEALLSLISEAIKVKKVQSIK